MNQPEDADDVEHAFGLAELVGVLLFYGAVSGGFWTAVIVCSSWLTDRGYGALAIVLVGLWLLISAPVLYAQAGAMVDILGRVLIGHTGIVPRLLKTVDDPPVEGWIRAVATFASLTSPMALPSALALYKLAPSTRLFEVILRKTQIETRVAAIAVDRLWQAVERDE